MLKYAWACVFSAFICMACGEKKEKKETIKIDKKVETNDPIERIDSAELKKREAEMARLDSIQKANDEKEQKAKQECATKVLFIEKFYEDYFKNPDNAVAQYCTSRLYGELKSLASQYEGNAIPVWIFASGSCANVSYKVNIPENPFSNTFMVNMSEKGQSYKVQLTVVGKDGYYSIDNVNNSLGY
jgi:hypothetical protein